MPMHSIEWILGGKKRFDQKESSHFRQPKMKMDENGLRILESVTTPSIEIKPSAIRIQQKTAAHIHSSSGNLYLV